MTSAPDDDDPDDQPDPQQHRYLLDGFHQNVWIGAPGDSRTLTSPAIMFDQIKSDIGAAANWVRCYLLNKDKSMIIVTLHF